MKKLGLALLLGSLGFASPASSDPPLLWQKKLNAATYLDDPLLAHDLANEAVAVGLGTVEIKQAVLSLLVRVGDERKALRLYRELQSSLTQEEQDKLIEPLAWATINRGSHSESPPVRAIALLAAALGNDARGVKILKKHLGDSNRILRLIAVQLSGKFRDGTLKEAIYKQLKQEKDPEIKVALIESAGSMQIKKAKGELLKILESSGSSAEETGAAVEALVAMSKGMEKGEIYRLVQNPRSCIRDLAAALIAFQSSPSDAPFLLKLLNDPHPAVRRRALESLGSLRVAKAGEMALDEALYPLLADPNREVSLTAAWVLMLHEPKKGQFYIRDAWSRLDFSDRLYVTALLGAGGRYAFPLAEELFDETQDPFLKLNLALCLLHSDVKPQEAMDVLYEGVRNHEARWMKRKWGRFEARAPSVLCHRADIPRFPEVVNQIERLEVLNELAQRRYPQAQIAISSFLNERLFGVSGAAAFLLLSEGDDDALDLIKANLESPSERIKMQAALALGILGSDPAALSTLSSLYPGSSRDQKEQILEAMGKISDRSTLPFLIDRLEESQQVLRIMAAAAIIRILND